MPLTPTRTAPLSDLPLAGGGKESCIAVAGVALVADCAGALYWPEEGLLAVADLHLEKGSSFAKRGVFLPPYDTASTLARLGQLIARYAPRIVIALGDNFHDGGGADRLQDGDRDHLRALQRARDWVWITGNHDPEPARNIGGFFPASLSIGVLSFRHEPTPQADDGEIAGHLHPVARVTQRGRTVSRRCFATNGKQAILPAFGAYTGGLNIRHHAFLEVFGTLAFTAHMLGDNRLYAFAAKRCVGD
jgi:DNA ligase-associated metallophosphoesterase